MAEPINKPVEEKAIEREYLFPIEGVTVKATSKEEAEKKVADIVKARININK